MSSLSSRQSIVVEEATNTSYVSSLPNGFMLCGTCVRTKRRELSEEKLFSVGFYVDAVPCIARVNAASKSLITSHIQQLQHNTQFYRVLVAGGYPCCFLITFKSVMTPALIHNIFSVELTQRGVSNETCRLFLDAVTRDYKPGQRMLLSMDGNRLTKVETDIVSSVGPLPVIESTDLSVSLRAMFLDDQSPLNTVRHQLVSLFPSVLSAVQKKAKLLKQQQMFDKDPEKDGFVMVSSSSSMNLTKSNSNINNNTNTNTNTNTMKQSSHRDSSRSHNPRSPSNLEEGSVSVISHSFSSQAKESTSASDELNRQFGLSLDVSSASYNRDANAYKDIINNSSALMSPVNASLADDSRAQDMAPPRQFSLYAHDHSSADLSQRSLQRVASGRSEGLDSSLSGFDANQSMMSMPSMMSAAPVYNTFGNNVCLTSRSGYMYKHAFGFFGDKWRLRFFQLSGCLLAYRLRPDAELRGCLDLTQCSIYVEKVRRTLDVSEPTLINAPTNTQVNEHVVFNITSMRTAETYRLSTDPDTARMWLRALCVTITAARSEEQRMKAMIRNSAVQGQVNGNAYNTQERRRSVGMTSADASPDVRQVLKSNTLPTPQQGLHHHVQQTLERDDEVLPNYVRNILDNNLTTSSLNTPVKSILSSIDFVPETQDFPSHSVQREDSVVTKLHKAKSVTKSKQHSTTSKQTKSKCRLDLLLASLLIVVQCLALYVLIYQPHVVHHVPIFHEFLVSFNEKHQQFSPKEVSVPIVTFADDINIVSLSSSHQNPSKIETNTPKVGSTESKDLN